MKKGEAKRKSGSDVEQGLSRRVGKPGPSGKRGRGLPGGGGDPDGSGLATAILVPGAADRLLAGHPWVYEGSVMRLTGPAADGAVVQIRDHRHRYLGIGLYHSGSRIRIRWLAAERVAVDRAFFEGRIREALRVRERWMPGATSYRVVNSESDFLSGLVVDRYGDVLVVQITSFAMEQRKPLIVEALRSVLNPRSILERSDTAVRRLEGLEPVRGVLWGEPVERVSVTLGGLRHDVELEGGHKTGLYLDQQVNQERVGKMARGGDVLDAFCFNGGFALQAARQGARSVLGLDQSAEAVAQATANAAANGLSGSVRFEAANVFDWLRERTRPVPVPGAGEGAAGFDLVILDPPSFTRSRDSVEDAVRGYKEIHLRALKLLRPHGVLATFCCSHHVGAQLFEDVVLSAAFDARRALRRVAVYHQGPDHPVLPAVRETEYLKGFAYEAVG